MTLLTDGRLHFHEFDSRIFRNPRTLRVWIPPGYDATGRTRYRVLYLNDGQNLFDPATAFAAVDWQAGKTAERLIQEQKIPPLIMVGIDHGGKDRIREYVPYRSLDPMVFGPLGKRYPDFLEREVIPLIEKNYAVAKGPEHTGLGGSSLGGLITLYTHLVMPGSFGRLLIESPSLFVANRRILGECRRFQAWPFRVYLAVGTREAGAPEKDQKAVENVRELESILRASLRDQRLRVVIDEGAVHGESAWAARLPAALEFLYGN